MGGADSGRAVRLREMPDADRGRGDPVSPLEHKIAKLGFSGIFDVWSGERVGCSPVAVHGAAARASARERERGAASAIGSRTVAPCTKTRSLRQRMCDALECLSVSVAQVKLRTETLWIFTSLSN